LGDGRDFEGPPPPPETNNRNGDIPKKNKKRNVAKPVRERKANQKHRDGKLFMATAGRARTRILARGSGGFFFFFGYRGSPEKKTRTGLPPSGFTMGNSALRISRTLLGGFEQKGPSGKKEGV